MIKLHRKILYYIGAALQIVLIRKKIPFLLTNKSKSNSILDEQGSLEPFQGEPSFLFFVHGGNMTVTLGAFKQQVLKVINKVYMDLFSNGLERAVLIVQGNMMIQTGISRRLPCLAAFDAQYPLIERLRQDALYNNMLKVKIKEAFESSFGIKIAEIFKDYNPATSNTICVLTFEHEIEYYLDKVHLPQ